MLITDEWAATTQACGQAQQDSVVQAMLPINQWPINK